MNLDSFCLSIANRLPRRLVMWCFFRVVCDATTGKYGDQIVADLTCMDAVEKHNTQREWEDAGVKPMDKRIRVRFWREVDKVYREGLKQINMSRILNGDMHLHHFYKILNNPVRGGYIFTKPNDHELENEILLQQAFEEMKEILDLPVRMGKKINTALVNSKIAIWKELSDRRLGQSVQRVQQHTVIEKTPEKNKTLEQINQELKELEDASNNELPILEAVEIEDSP